MNTEHLKVWRQIEAFDIDGPEPISFPFGARLARENRWTRVYAERVVREYKRFVFLAMISSTHVTPSEEIDQAWHLHMIYSRSYWERFCRDLLQRPLHHEPTRGGTEEHDKHLRQYQKTLDLYRETFHHEPPRDIWPLPEERFREGTEGFHVDAAKYWIVAKPNRLLKASGIAAAISLLALLSIGCAGWNPFALKGPEFLSYFIPALILSLFAGLIIRKILSRVDPPAMDDPGTFTWEEAAYLTGEKKGLTLAALSRMIENRVAVYDPDLEKVEHGPNGEQAETRVERKIWQQLPISYGNKFYFDRLADEVEAAFAPQEISLQERGYLLSHEQARTAALYSILPLATLLMFVGLPRCIQGVANGKPIGILVVVMIVGLILVWTNFSGRRRRTRMTERILAQNRTENLHLRDQKNWASPEHAALAVALFGGSVLAGSHIASLRKWYHPYGYGSSSGCSSGGDGGGGGGGCGGG